MLHTLPRVPYPEGELSTGCSLLLPTRTAYCSPTVQPDPWCPLSTSFGEAVLLLPLPLWIPAPSRLT